MTITAEILCLGNELLIGRTINKNATDLGLKLSRLGIEVQRVICIKDDLKLGTQVIHEILNRKPDVLCITGGLGPTHDDIQLEILAIALIRPLILNQEALGMITQRYSTLNESRKKMAKIPTDSLPLFNSKGSAPGVYTHYNSTHIFSMPGVPIEMNTIFDEKVAIKIAEIFPTSIKLFEFGIDIFDVKESEIATITENVMSQFPDVSFKSHPKFDGSKYWLSLHTYAFIDNYTIVKLALEKWVKTIEKKFDIKKGELGPVFSKDFIPD